MNRWSVLFLVTLSLAGVSLSAHGNENGNDNKLRCWAIIASPEIVRDGLPDLMTVAFSEDSTIDLVERQELAAITRELEVSICSGAAAIQQRLQLGRTLKADALVLLSLEKPVDTPAEGESDQVLRMIVAESRSGTRLLIDYLPYEKDHLAELAERSFKKVSETRRRFTGGIDRTICVTQFLSKNLVHDYDHLQSGYAGLLSDALTVFPGIAVVEIEEARAIAAELRQSGDELTKGIVPLTVSAEFEVAKAAPADKATIELTVEITRAGELVSRGKLQNLLLEDVPELIRGKLARAIAQRSAAAGPGLSIDEQFETLTKRADTFSQFGACNHSTTLREAALLLKPSDLDQKFALVIEYYRQLLSQNRETWSRLVTERLNQPERPEDAEQWAIAHAECLEILRIEAHHIEQLIRRREVNPLEAQVLLDRFLAAVNSSNNIRYGEEQILRTKDFLEPFAWRVLPLFSSLDPNLRNGGLHPSLRGHTIFKEDKSTAELQFDWWTHTAIRMLTFDLPTLRNGGRPFPENHAQTFKDMERFLTAVSDAEKPIPHMAHMTMRGGFSAIGLRYNKVFDEQLDDFYRRLKQSDKPWNEFYGRCGILRYAALRHPDVDIGRPLQEEIHDLRTIVQRELAGDANLKIRSEFEQCLDTLEQIIARKPTTRPKITTIPHPSPDKTPAESLPAEMRFNELDVRCNFQHVIPCGDQLDLAWSSHQVVLARDVAIKRGGVQPTYLHHAMGDDDRVAAVHWDGRLVWVVTTGDGIRVFDTGAQQLVHFQRPQVTDDENHGPPPEPQPQQGTRVSPVDAKTLESKVQIELLPYERMWKVYPGRIQPLHIHPLGNGRAIIIGRYGKLSRLWFAHAQVKDPEKGTATIGTFHTCTKVRSHPETADDDVQQSFTPNWITEWQDPKTGHRLLLVARRQDYGDLRIGRRPLAIDVESFEVSVYPARFPSAGAASHYSFDGRILEIERSGVRIFTPGTDPTEWDSERVSFGDYRKKTIGRVDPILIERDGFLYFPGTQWWRIDRATWNPKKLTEDILPESSQFSCFGLSARCGLLAWNPLRTLYQVEINEEP